MKVVQINTFPYKATGTIMMNIHHLLVQEGYEAYVVWGRGRNSQNKYEISIKDDLGVKFHGFYTRITDKTGFASWKSTRKLISKLEEIKPDIIHLHNIHGYYLNIEMLFDYIKKNKIKVVWTLHDCWPMTGHCAYFDMVECDKWISGCSQCEQKNTYPASKVMDSSAWNWKKKKEFFSGLDAHIVTPCNWLKEIVKKSYLNKYSTKVIYNGIDTDIFRPRYNKDLRKKYSPDGRPIVLGVASEWTERKGLADFVRLAREYRDINFIVIGVSTEQIRQLPKELTGVYRTSNVDELVEFYSIADVFFNPTYEDNFPTTNLEALACGTPIITYDTGGSPEVVENAIKDSGKVIGTVVKTLSPRIVDLKAVAEEIYRMIQYTNEDDQARKECRNIALSYGNAQRLTDYINLYKEIVL